MEFDKLEGRKKRMQRDKSLDIAKAIAILLMIYGHFRYTVINMDTLYGWIYSFHMPVFILISGWLTVVKTEGKRDLLIKKIKKILFPYIIWIIIGFLVNLLFGLTEESVSDLIHGIAVGDNLISNLPTWYLLSYFWIALFAIYILPFLDSVKKLVAADLISVIPVFLVAYVPDLQDYFRLKGALVLLPFFITGYLLQKIRFLLPWWMIVPLFYIGYILERINAVRSWGSVTVGNGDIGVPYLYLLSALCTSVALLTLCRYLARIPFMDIIGVFGRNTRMILCTHWIIGNVIGIWVAHSPRLFRYVFFAECILVGGHELLDHIRLKGKRNERKEA